MSKSDKDFRVIENRLVNKLNSFSEINESELKIQKVNFYFYP